MQARRGRGCGRTRAGGLALACAALAPAAAAPRDAWSLYRALMDAGEVVYVVPADVDLELLRGAVLNLEAAGHHRGRIEVLADGEGAPPGSTRESACRVVLGGFREAPARELAEHLRIEPMPRGFRYEGRTYVDDLDAIVATFEEPGRPGRPVTLVFGNDPARLVPLLRDTLPGWRPHATCYAEGELERSAPLGPGDRWLHAYQTTWEGERARRRATDRQVRLRRLLLSVPEGTDADQLDAFADLLDGARSRLMAWVAPNARVPLLEVVLYTHPEDMAALVGRLDLGWHDPLTERAHVLFAPGLTHDGGAAVARAAAVALLGPPRDPWLLDAAGVHAAGRWWDRPLLPWIAWLRRAGVVPRIEELLDAHAAERTSPHVVSPLRGLLLQTLLDERGREHVIDLWRGDAPLALDDELREAFTRRLDAALRLYAAPMEELARERLRRARLGAFRSGVVFTREGAPLPGYASRDAGESLARAAAHGANALALFVEGYQQPGLPLETPRSSHAGRPASDPDLALAQAAAAGRGLGLRPLLAPQLLSTPWGGLAGQRVMPDLADWEAFFAALDPFLVHYALLAELTACELFAVASDLPTATGVLPLEDEDEADPLVVARQELRHAEWERIVDRVRLCFSGGLTYGSGWRAPRVSFASRLDFLGHDLFEPVAGSDQVGLVPVREHLVRRLAGTLGYLADEAAEQGLGALVLAAGFTSTERTWVSPATPRGRTDPEVQRTMYEVLAEALRRQGWRDERVQGLYVWRWSTEPEAGGHGDRGFTPQNKPAEDVLDELFGVLR